MTVLFDKLNYVDRLKLSGIEEAVARAHAEALDTALHEGVATKADLREAVDELRGEIAVTRSELDGRITELDGRITELDGRIAALDGRINDVSQGMRAMEAGLRGEITALRADMGTLEANLRKEMAAMDAAQQARIARVENNLDVFKTAVDHRFLALEEMIRGSEQRVTIRLGGMLVVGIGVIAVLIQLG